MIRIIYVILLSFLFFSCSKKEMIHVSAINPVTGAPYAGLRFTITEEKTGTQEIFTKVYDSYLNAFGEALFQFKLKKNRSYKLSLETPTNNCYKEPADITFAIQDKSFDFKFELAPCAYLKHKFNNIACFNEFDSLKFKILNFKNNYTNSKFQNFIGCINFDSGDFSSVPYGEVRYYWEVVKNGITNTFYDTILLNEGEYRTYEINY
jgi:hypothetical protein